MGASAAGLRCGRVTSSSSFFSLAAVFPRHPRAHSRHAGSANPSSSSLTMYGSRVSSRYPRQTHASLPSALREPRYGSKSGSVTSRKRFESVTARLARVRTMSSRTTGMSATPSGGGTSGGRVRARCSAMEESMDESTHPTSLLGRLSSPRRVGGAAAAEKTAAREETHAHLPVRSAADAHVHDHGDARGRGESGPARVASCARVGAPPPPAFPPFCRFKKTRHDTQLDRKNWKKDDAPRVGIGTAVQSEKSPKLGRQPKSSTAPDCRAARSPRCCTTHVSRKAAGRTQWVAHTRRRSRRRRESRDTHASGGSQSPVESTPTRLQIHRTGAALEVTRGESRGESTPACGFYRR